MVKNEKEQEELLAIVSRLTELYTSRESTSIPFEKARMLMEAALYCIQETEAEKIDGLSLVDGAESLELAYEHGYQLVLEKTKRANQMYNQLIPRFMAYDNRCYYDTVVKGLPQFFLYYDARFCPQNHLLTLDYPVLMQMEQLTGIDRIEQYVYCIILEQRFLAGLDENRVGHVLSRYEYEFEEAIVNVCSPILRYQIAACLLELPYGTLEFTKENIDCLVALVKGKGNGELLVACQQALHSIVEKRYGNQLEMYSYLCCDLQDFVIELRNVCENDCIEVMFPL